MKYPFYFFLLCLFFFACIKPQDQNVPQKNNQTNPEEIQNTSGITQTTTVLDQETGNPIQAEKPINALSSAIGKNPVTKEDKTIPALIKPEPKTAQEQRVMRILTTEYWAVWALIRIKDKPANRNNQGTWFKFNPDGTYEYGFWELPISSGTWSFDGQNALLHLDSKLLGDDREWNIKMGNDEDVMVWVGTERYHTPDIQLKLQRYFSIPKTRAELGVTE